METGTITIFGKKFLRIRRFLSSIIRDMIDFFKYLAASIIPSKIDGANRKIEYSELRYLYSWEFSRILQSFLSFIFFSSISLLLLRYELRITVFCFSTAAKKLPKNDGGGGAGGSSGQGRRLDGADDGPKTPSSCCKWSIPRPHVSSAYSRPSFLFQFFLRNRGVFSLCLFFF